MNLSGKNVTVMGLGLHGGALGTVTWLISQGAKVLVTDIKTREQLAPSLEALKKYPDITYVLGEHREEDFVNADLVIRNPGVPASSPYLQAATQRKVPIEMDSSLFFLNCPTTDVIGVTGSKGKTTTAKAITAVLTAGGHHVVEVGTDGSSPLGKLPEVTATSTVVFELSSWRLEGLAAHQISPRTAVVTSLLPDHQNTYASMDAYEEVKKGIVRFQKEADSAYLNRDDVRLQAWSADVPGTLHWFTYSDFEDGELGISADVIPLLGQHQKTNVLPAIHIAHSRGIPLAVIQRAVTAFQQIPHRLESVRVLNDIQFINNSAATIPEATIAALDALAGQSLVLILGGGDKKLTFTDLAAAIASQRVVYIVWLPGTATEAMRKAVHAKSSPPEYMATSMQDAVEHAYKTAKPGYTVLLSPAATSFGMFTHEFDRGNQFRAATLALN